MQTGVTGKGAHDELDRNPSFPGAAAVLAGVGGSGGARLGRRARWRRPLVVTRTPADPQGDRAGDRAGPKGAAPGPDRLAVDRPSLHRRVCRCAGTAVARAESLTTTSVIGVVVGGVRWRRRGWAGRRAPD